uniref:Carbohydrate sulfotransferase 6 n=1 Tax=Neogobius melanostomus TaxID=47308 RepID=A0A8C6U5C7_9GOBI
MCSSALRSAPPQEVHVLLLSSWRSGSSFLGQVFTAWHVWTTLQRPGPGPRMAVRDLLRSTYHCDFSTMEATCPAAQRVQPVMWSHSGRCARPRCGLQCSVRGLAGAERACRTYSHVVLKEVRSLSWSLCTSPAGPELDLRIVHLVRDPRACCAPERSPPREGPPHTPPYLEGRYKLVRYEDLARNPLEEISSIYEFVSLEMTQLCRTGFIESPTAKAKAPKGGFQITSRTPWTCLRRGAPCCHTVRCGACRTLCRVAMSMLGYRTVNSDKEQKKLDIDLLAPHVQPSESHGYSCYTCAEINIIVQFRKPIFIS